MRKSSGNSNNGKRIEQRRVLAKVLLCKAGSKKCQYRSPAVEKSDKI